MLFEILAGTPLIPTDGGRSEMQKRTLVGVDAHISVRIPDSKIAPELEAVCVRATHREPELRFQSARELHDAVDDFLAGHRDVEMRRVLASERMEEAERLCQRALAGDGTNAQRSDVLRRVGQVLALQPDNEAAQAMLERIMSTPPKKLPAEVARAMAAQTSAGVGRANAMATIVSFAVALFAVLPACTFMGVANGRYAAILIASWIVAGVASFVAYKQRPRVPYATFFVLTAVACTSLLCGSLIIVPTAAAVAAMVALSTAHRGHRVLIIGAAFAAVLAPWIGEQVGLIPVAYEYETDRMLVLPRAVSFPPGASRVFLVVAQVLTLGAVAGFAVFTRRAMDRAALRVLMAQWHVKRLVPGAFTEDVPHSMPHSSPHSVPKSEP